MMNARLAASAALAVALAAPAALAQRAMQFDLNNLNFQAENSGGLPGAFGGLNHTGSVVLTTAAPSQLVDLALRASPGQAFLAQAAQNLTNLTMNINLTSGMVTGGTFSLDINGGPGGGGDRYTANIGSAGTVTPFVGGGFKIEGLTSAGAFSDSTFATVPISDFMGSVTGSFLSFRINPDANGHSFADVDAFVNAVPAPGSIACVALGVLVAARRRRH